MRRPFRIAPTLAVAVLLLAACSEASQDTPAEDQLAPDEATEDDAATDDPADDAAEDQGEDASTEATGDDAAADEQRYPDVIDAELERTGDDWRLSATISSPYDSAERYADAFRALTPAGEQLGVRELLHDHAGEQPFTRSLDGLEVPDDVDEIVVEGRDQRYGWGGDTVTLAVPER